MQKRGAAIIEARGLSSAASAANAAIDHVRDWVARHAATATGSRMGVPSDGSYGIPEGVIYGYPVTCKGGQYEIVKGLEVSEFSREPHADATLKELHEERDGVKHLLGDERRASVSARRSAQEKPLQVIGTINAYHALLAKRAGFTRDLPLRRRRRRRLARPAGPRHLRPRRRAHRRPPHHRRLRPAAAGRRRHRLRRQRLQRRAHRALADQVRRRRRCTSRTRSAPSAAAIARQGDRLHATRWSTASRPRSTRAPIPSFVIMARTDALASRRARSARSSAPSPASRPAPT